MEISFGNEGFQLVEALCSFFAYVVDVCVPLEIFTDDDTENFQIFADRKHLGDLKANRSSRCKKNFRLFDIQRESTVRAESSDMFCLAVDSALNVSLIWSS